MSRRLMKVCIVGALLVSAFVGASSASANWTTNGDATGVAFSGSAGASKLGVTATGSTVGVQGITCTSSSNTGSLFGPSLASGSGIASVLPIFGGTCQVVGQTAAVKCGNATLNGLTYSAVTNVSAGNLTGISCVVAKTSGACGNATTFTGGGITVTGTVNGSYGNTSQQLTIDLAAQNLKASWNSTGCLQGTGTGSATGAFSNASGTALTYSVTSAFKPQATS
jgi:hypothetical protein